MKTINDIDIKESTKKVTKETEKKEKGICWTLDQKKVIETTGKDILVSAAAGSGKTAVLVERIIKRVLDEKNPVDIDKILVLTFTKDAAKEMKDRIRKALWKKLQDEENTKGLKKRLKRQSIMVDYANISTIDSFCTNIVRNYFAKIGVDPNFRVIDEAESKILKEEALKDVFIEKYKDKKDKSEDNKKFLKLVSTYKYKNKDTEVREMVKSIFEKGETMPWPGEWLNGLIKIYNIENEKEFNELDMSRKILTFYKEYLHGVIGQIEKTREEYHYEYNYYDMDETMDNDIETINEWINHTGGTLAEFFAFILDDDKKSEAKFKNICKSENKELKEQFKDIRDQYKKNTNALKPKTLAKGMSVSDINDVFINEIQILKPFVEELIDLVNAFTKAYHDKKDDLSVVDFSDLEHFALNILIDKDTKEKTEVAKEISEMFNEVMVDEYQDSNQIQETLLSTIAHNENENKYFMVGDVKQSIYAFRSADPGIFMEKFDDFKKEDETKVRIDLNKNFRSRNEILDFTNDIFSYIMDKDMGGVSYDEDAFLNKGAKFFDENEIEGDLNHKDDNIDKKEYITKHKDDYASEVYFLHPDDKEIEKFVCVDKEEYEYKFTAKRIKKLIKSGLKIQDKTTKKPRNVSYKDIVILSRSVSDEYGKMTKLLNIFKNENIPVVMAETAGYFDTMEISVLLSFLEIIDNPYKDIELISVLHSPMFNISNDELLRIKEKQAKINKNLQDKEENKKRRQKTKFFAALISYLNSEGEDEDLKPSNGIKKFMSLYNDIRDSYDLSISDIIIKILNETDFLHTISAMPGGNQKRANIEKLIDEAGLNENVNQDLHSFLQYIRNRKKYKSEISMAKLQGEEDDVVRVMTIHKSKGLEFPVVFLLNCMGNFNSNDSKQKFMVDSKLGLALRKYDSPINRVVKDTFFFEMIKTLKKIRERGEDQRILYVALTRAKEKLILVGSKKDEEILPKSDEILPKKMLFYDKYSAKTYFDWIIPAMKKAIKNGDKCKFITELDDSYYEDESVSNDNMENISENSENISENSEEYDKNVMDSILNRMNYHYKFLNNNRFKNKYSVSELKGDAMDIIFDDVSDDNNKNSDKIQKEYVNKKDMKNEFLVPNFMKSENKKEVKNYGTMYGTIMHKALEKLDFSLSYSKESLDESINNLIYNNIIDKDYADIIDREAIFSFLNNNISKELFSPLKHNKVLKEQSFVFIEDVKNIFSDKKFLDSEKILIQGVIDCMVVSDEGITIIDYKTDKLKKDEEFIEKYKKQLQLYAIAASKSYNVKIKKLYIYSLNLNKYIEVLPL